MAGRENAQSWRRWSARHNGRRLITVCVQLKAVVEDMGHGYQFLGFEGGDAYSRKLPIWVWKWSTGPKSRDGLTLRMRASSIRRSQLEGDER